MLPSLATLFNIDHLLEISDEKGSGWLKLLLTSGAVGVFGSLAAVWLTNRHSMKIQSQAQKKRRK
ncbi:MAG: hypothetical protein K8R87_08120 [Verrucomicrobia bacterium]|nr:hypothetical protein [Verrucomicrobiota bacterium]